MTLPSPPPSNSSSSGTRPAHRPIMGTSLYTGIQRSPTFPNGYQDGFPSPSSQLPPPHAFNNPLYGSKRAVVSVQTQTSHEQITELDETIVSVEPGRTQSFCQGDHPLQRRHQQRRPQRRHTYINLLDDPELSKGPKRVGQQW